MENQMNQIPMIVPIKLCQRRDRVSHRGITYTVISVDPDGMARVFHGSSRTEAFMMPEVRVSILPPFYEEGLPQ